MQGHAATSGAKPAGLDLVVRALALPLADPAAEAIAVALFVPLTLAVALWNGFPIIFYDTGAYLLEGLGRVFLAERSPVYSLFLDYGGARVSLWFVVLLQAAAAAFVIVEAARAVAPRLQLATLLAIGVGLTVLTGLPWYTGQIEPDIFAPLAVLSLYLLAFHHDVLAGWRSWLIIAVAILSIAVHPSHLLLGDGLLAMIVAYRVVLWAAKRNDWPSVEIARPVLACVFGLALIVASNFTLTREVFVSRAGPVFVFARLLQDRIVMRLLDDTCPDAHYRLCAYKEVLPRTADQWLWGRGSPFLALGRFEGTSAESSRIVWDSFVRYPALQLEVALGDAAHQFVTFRTGDQIEPQEWVLLHPLGEFIPRQLRAYLAARQQQGGIDFRPINLLHLTVAWLSLLGLVAAFAVAWRRRERKSAVFFGFILAALVSNAVICGALSNPHDRYQSRLIWLAPFGLALIVGDWPIFALRGLGESGT
ncbi:MAG TPA: hypothetical protein VKB71_09215 [Rhizomicrobium sp.]|nr:hypothetical protein [Rhizomicrobium sp.]